MAFVVISKLRNSGVQLDLKSSLHILEEKEGSSWQLEGNPSFLIL